MTTFNLILCTTADSLDLLAVFGNRLIYICWFIIELGIAGFFCDVAFGGGSSSLGSCLIPTNPVAVLVSVPVSATAILRSHAFGSALGIDRILAARWLERAGGHTMILAGVGVDWC